MFQSLFGTARKRILGEDCRFLYYSVSLNGVKFKHTPEIYSIKRLTKNVTWHDFSVIEGHRNNFSTPPPQEDFFFFSYLIYSLNSSNSCSSNCIQMEWLFVEISLKIMLILRQQTKFLVKSFTECYLCFLQFSTRLTPITILSRNIIRNDLETTRL